jgi:hypothetical protein
MTPLEAQQIVQDYGAALEEKTALGVVRDINSLPHPKEKIKIALLFALSVTTDPTMREHLKGGYVSLSDFQELSDEQVKALQIWNKTVMGSEDKMTADEIQDAVAAISHTGKEVTSLQAKCMSEAEALSRELRAAGF